MSEKVYTINISAANGTDRRQRARKAIDMVSNYIEKHTKATPLIGQNLNKAIWSHGGKRVQNRVKISVDVKDGFARAELFGHQFNERTKIEINKERNEKKKAKKPEQKEETVEEKTEKVHKDDQNVESKKAHDLKKEEKAEKVEKKSKYKTSNIESHQSKS